MQINRGPKIDEKWLVGFCFQQAMAILSSSPSKVCPLTTEKGKSHFIIQSKSEKNKYLNTNLSLMNDK